MSSTVHVTGISSKTSESEVRDFFSFCGKIQNLSVTKESDDAGADQSATVTFEKETAAKTAMLLDNTQLGAAQVHVTSGQSLDQAAGGKTAGSYDEPASSGDIQQEDKPRSRVLAEYLAHGYRVSDQAIEKAIALDQQHGVSNRFMGMLQQLDEKTQASTRAAQVDKQYGITDRASSAWVGLASYFDKAASTPTGQKLRSFYVEGQKQVLDVHNEAKHLASLKAGKPTPEEAEMHTVGDGNRTECNCKSDTGKCPCEPGKCACSSCAKNPDAQTTEKTAEQAST